MEYNPNDYPAVVVLRFRSKEHAECVLHELESEVQTVKYNEAEKGENIYYVDSCFPDPD